MILRIGVRKNRRGCTIVVSNVVEKTVLINSKAVEKAKIKIDFEERLIYRLIKEGSVSEVIIIINDEVVIRKTLGEYPQSKLLRNMEIISNICNTFYSNHDKRYEEVMGALKIKCLLSDDFQKILIYSPKKGVLIISRMSFMEDEEKIWKIIEDIFLQL